MWPFKKKVTSLEESGMLNGLTDWHSHILPGVDDGVPSMDLSLELLDAYEKFGVREIWLTPHIMEDYPNTVEGLTKKFDELTGVYKGPIKLNLAAEHMLDSLFQDRLIDNQVLPIGKEKKHLLVETSYFNPPVELDSIFDHIFSAGYFPLLAHPERYRYMDKKKYQELKDRGILFQMNYTSIVGGYGNVAQEKVQWLLKNDMIDVVGSDVHRLAAIDKLIKLSPTKNDYLGMILDVARNPKI